MTSYTYHGGDYDCVVIGAGHAGCEAALATARMGHRTLLLTINLDGIALLACNPAIGGTAKGHLVREVDALGGEMALCADKTLIQSRMLNTSKGPAVHSLRAQTDKKAYQSQMKYTLEHTENLWVRQAEVAEIQHQHGKISAVVTTYGAQFTCRTAIVSTGVYLKGRVLIGNHAFSSGPSGLFPAMALSASLSDCGLQLKRFKTGTPARVDGRTVDFSKTQRQDGDEHIVPFSFKTNGIAIEQQPCFLTYTNEHTHAIIRENLHRSPLYSGLIEGVGPRYCPSIEDKVVRFADKERHPVFIEPEGLHTTEMYVQGASTSLPEEVQLAFLHTIAGLENAAMMRPAYAIEYDLIESTQLAPTLCYRDIEGLYFAGQINGSSGYEEAAGQGIIAGINAALYLQGRDPLVLTRADGYIGVLVDDLVTKETTEPYRMMTSRSEYRLLLRQDNADLRLTEMGYQAGLADEQRYRAMVQKAEQTQKQLNKLRAAVLPPVDALAKLLQSRGEAPLQTGIPAHELLKRPGMRYTDLQGILPDYEPLAPEVQEEVEISLRYEGYIRRQQNQVDQFKKTENKLLPPDLDYSAIDGLRLEARQKLAAMRPKSLGQVGRISGVSPADITVLILYLSRQGQN